MECAVATIAPELIAAPARGDIEVVPSIVIDVHHRDRGMLVERVPGEDVDPVVLGVGEGGSSREKDFLQVALVNGTACAVETSGVRNGVAKAVAKKGRGGSGRFHRLRRPLGDLPLVVVFLPKEGHLALPRRDGT